MKVLTKFLLCVGALALTSAPSTVWAAPVGPCVQGTLASYIALGSAGCTIDDKTFSSFAYAGGPPAAANITVTPEQPSLGVDGLQFTGSWVLSGLNLSLDSNIQFNLATTSGAALIKDASFAVLPNITGAAQLSVLEALCLGSTTCPGSSGNAQLFAAGAAGTINLGSQTVFTPTGILHAAKDIGLNTCVTPNGTGNCTDGQVGSITFSQIEDDFSQVVPIPGTLPLFATGLVGLWGLRRKRQNSRAALAA